MKWNISAASIWDFTPQMWIFELCWQSVDEFLSFFFTKGTRMLLSFTGVQTKLFPWAESQFKFKGHVAGWGAGSSVPEQAIAYVITINMQKKIIKEEEKRKA